MTNHSHCIQRCLSALPLWTLDFVAHPVGLQVYTCLVYPVFSTKLNSEGSTAVNVAFPKCFPHPSSHTHYCSDHWACQSLTAQACSALGTGTSVVRAACASMLTGWHTGCSHRLFTELSSETFGTAAPVEAHTHAAIYARFLAHNRLYLASSSLPSTSTCAFVDVHTSSPILTGRSAKGQEALGASVVGGTLAGVRSHTATTVGTRKLTHSCVAACSCPAATTQTLVPAHTGTSMSAGRGAHG